MGVFTVVSILVIFGMMYLGLVQTLEPKIESRVVGICTLLWISLALFIFVAIWFPSKWHDPYSLAFITFLSVTGYPTGRSLAFLARPAIVKWELRERQPAPRYPMVITKAASNPTQREIGRRGLHSLERESGPAIG